MENASKALIMAGTILIGILLIALLVYFFNSVLGVDKAYKANVSTTRLVEFNTKFTKYNITQKQYEESDEKNYVRIYDIITLGNLAKEFNSSNELNETDDEYITISIPKVSGAKNIQGNTVEENNELLVRWNDPKYKFVSISNKIEYSSSGRIKCMEFDFAKETR